jgi:hypothetical protein
MLCLLQFKFFSHFVLALLIFSGECTYSQHIPEDNRGKAAFSGRNHLGVFKYRSRTDYKENVQEFRNYSENYFHIESDENSLWNGRHWNKNNFPLKVYIIKSESKYYKPVYNTYIKYALEVWEKADKRISFMIVSSTDSANVIIRFVDNLKQKYDENYLGLTKTEFSTENSNEISKADVQLSLLKFGTKNIADGEMKATTIHEMGHVLGLGHSENDKDLMYPYIDPLWNKDLDYNELSSGDYLAIHSLTDLGFKH